MSLAQRLRNKVRAPINVDVTWTDENDWSVSISDGVSTMILTAANTSYTKFTVLRATPEGVDVMEEDVSMTEALRVA